MSRDPDPAESPRTRRPRPVHLPSRLAQAALLLVGALALMLLVAQITAPGHNGIISDHDRSFPAAQ